MGSDYAEARFQNSKSIAGVLKNGSPEPSMMFDSSGLGIRVIVNGALSFGATNILTKQSLRQVVTETVASARAISNTSLPGSQFSPSKSFSTTWSAEEKEKFEDITFQRLISLLRDADSSLKNGVKGIHLPNRLLTASASLEEKVFVNSEGSEIVGRVPRCLFRSYLTSNIDGSIRAFTIPPGYAQIGGSGGEEVFKGLDLPEYVANNANSIVDALSAKKKPPNEEVDVILGPGVTGLVAHESAGHPTEADRILGREAAQAGESYLNKDDLGLRVGSSEACVSDDPTIPHSMGFYIFDDEGIPARKRRIMDSGIISEFLHNRSTAEQFGLASNASSRSIGFDREPIIRMANTYVEPGNYSFEEMIKEIKLGVYIKSFMEWNIDDKRLNQRYVGLEGYLISGGEIRDSIRDPVLEVTTPKLWNSLDARGRDIEFIAATCGKGDPMQGAPVWTGGPHIRLRKMRIGSR